MLTWLGSKGRIDLDWEGAPRVTVEGEAWLWLASSMVNPSFFSGEAPTKMVERYERCDFFGKFTKCSLCLSATETSDSMIEPQKELYIF
ncbi:hypothetical protein BHE74_00045454 [Ensete ventricosum]|nr:hypothetical protein BHE74_00045454 [Ensete ventricosum]